MSGASPSSLARALGIEPGDFPLLRWLGLGLFLLNAGGCLAWVALTGRFIAKVGADKMPLIYIALNVVTAGLFLAMAARGGSESPRLYL